jgi:hypothetical protein
MVSVELEPPQWKFVASQFSSIAHLSTLELICAFFDNHDQSGRQSRSQQSFRPA